MKNNFYKLNIVNNNDFKIIFNLIIFGVLLAKINSYNLYDNLINNIINILNSNYYITFFIPVIIINVIINYNYIFCNNVRIRTKLTYIHYLFFSYIKIFLISILLIISVSIFFNNHYYNYSIKVFGKLGWELFVNFIKYYLFSAFTFQLLKKTNKYYIYILTMIVIFIQIFKITFNKIIVINSIRKVLLHIIFIYNFSYSNFYYKCLFDLLVIFIMLLSIVLLKIIKGEIHELSNQYII